MVALGSIKVRARPSVVPDAAGSASPAVDRQRLEVQALAAFTAATERLAVHRQWQWFAPIVRAARKVPCWEIPTIQISRDGWRVQYNPAYVCGLDADSQLADAVHEASHIAYRHPERQDGRDMRLWNDACDKAVDAVAALSGLPQHRDFPANAAYTFLAAEDIYDRLLAAQRPPEADGRHCLQERKACDLTIPQPADAGEQDHTQGGEGNGGQEEDQAAGAGDEPSDSDEDDKGDADVSGTTTDGGIADSSSDGGGLGAEKKAAGSQSGRSAPTGRTAEGNEDESDEELSADDLRAVQAEMEQAVVEAGRLLETAIADSPGLAKGVGTVLQVARLDTGELNWKAELFGYLGERRGRGYTWVRPSRRSHGVGVYLPGAGSTLPTAAVVLDGSVSIGDGRYYRQVGSSHDLLGYLGYVMRVLCHDADVYFDGIVTDIAQIPGPSRGGTNFEPVLDRLFLAPPAPTGHVGRPDVVVWHTDLQGLFGKWMHRPPPVPVVFCVFDWNEATIDRYKPAWGHIIRVRDRNGQNGRGV